MTIGDVAVVRTGFVTTRKMKGASRREPCKYRLLNLKCIADQGYIETEYLESYEISEELKRDYLTRKGDILIRLSSPYTAVIINRDELCGLLIPSHFAIVRVNAQLVVPEYVFWLLSQEKYRNIMIQNSSGSTSFGTISAGVIAALPIAILTLQEQELIGRLTMLAAREQELLYRLVTEKKKYNSARLTQIYDNMKRGNIQ